MEGIAQVDRFCAMEIQPYSLEANIVYLHGFVISISFFLLSALKMVSFKGLSFSDYPWNYSSALSQYKYAFSNFARLLLDYFSCLFIRFVAATKAPPLIRNSD